MCIASLMTLIEMIYELFIPPCIGFETPVEHLSDVIETGWCWYNYIVEANVSINSLLLFQ